MPAFEHVCPALPLPNPVYTMLNVLWHMRGKQACREECGAMAHMLGTSQPSLTCRQLARWSSLPSRMPL